MNVHQGDVDVEFRQSENDRHLLAILATNKMARRIMGAELACEIGRRYVLITDDDSVLCGLSDEQIRALSPGLAVVRRPIGTADYGGSRSLSEESGAMPGAKAWRSKGRNEGARRL